MYKPFPPKPPGPMGELHLHIFQLQDDTTSYFVRTRSGGKCFRRGTKLSTKESLVENQPKEINTNQRALLSVESKNMSSGPAQNSSAVKRLVKCRCLQGWHGDHCGIPTVVQHSNLPTKSRLVPREVPRRIINAININHEIDLLHARFHELVDVVDLFMVCESNFTAYGTPRKLLFFEQLMNGTFDYVRHKILYIFLDHFPKGGKQNGWIADDYLRTFLSKNGLSRMRGARPDDVFIINDADEIPVWEGIVFLKLFDGWTEPFRLHLRKSIYGFFWKQLGTLDVLSGCTVRMLFDVYKGNGIYLRRRDYYSMPGFRTYENNTGRILVPWSIGSPIHYAGWHCSWCFKPEGIYYKLVSAQNGDFPRWGDFEDKRKLSYIRRLIRTGGWFDGSVGHYPPTDPKEHMYAPKYFLDNYDQYEYLLRNIYTKTEQSLTVTE
ncbi:beta-1,4-mannosyl-glycoprotein 4-beta-N-acetylglucosaminyltransferase a isoform X2 [Alosa sapidissima]|nr:beta-1,4-mannosyl-glycoprotein 4-beta-N-acetylglucosaminyltransferase a isoform X2 [Alosa sapidissima]